MCYREKVREEIARDKAEKAAREQNKKQPQQPTTAASPIAPAATKNYDTCKLQVMSIHMYPIDC